ncbi:MAG TPA: hypothetical protein VMA72_16240 [Streptosporangiaceae bacterium]|nr:hypothetical protein [Streptosporangiaceae bacterium]
MPVLNRGRVFDVLFACHDDASTPARLVLPGPGWYLLTEPQFRRRPRSSEPVMMRAAGQCAGSSGC